MRLSDGFLRVPVDLPGTPAPSWVPPRWEPRAGGGGPGAAEVALPPSHRRPSKGSACSAFQGAITSLESSWTTFPLNLHTPPPPSPPPTQSFQDWVNKVHPRAVRNTGFEGFCCLEVTHKPTAIQAFADIVKQKTRLFLVQPPWKSCSLLAAIFAFCEHLHPTHQ